jgi:hypothetical protein
MARWRIVTAWAILAPVYALVTVSVVTTKILDGIVDIVTLPFTWAAYRICPDIHERTECL